MAAFPPQRVVLLIAIQYKPGVFKVANIDGWAVIAAGAQYIDEVRKAPDEVLSFVEATEHVRRDFRSIHDLLAEDQNSVSRSDTHLAQA